MLTAKESMGLLSIRGINGWEESPKSSQGGGFGTIMERQDDMEIAGASCRLLTPDKHPSGRIPRSPS